MQIMLSRTDGRKANELRSYSFEKSFIKTSEGSVLVNCGDTRVIVTAKPEDSVPPFLKDSGQGWLTAEYSMLPGSSNSRVRRERNKVNSRSTEIQRLIGRSLRAMVDLEKLGELTINIDCDVIQADGGTRTASITGAYVAVRECLEKLNSERELFPNGLPIVNQVAAISVGIVDGNPLLDLCYEEDSKAEADANFVMTADGQIIEVQATAEDGTFSEEDFSKMFELAKKGISDLVKLQNTQF